MIFCWGDDPQHRAKTADGREWKQLAEQLDEEFKSIRVATGRQVTKKSFSSVQVRRTSKSTQYQQGGEWSAEIRRNGFESGCCTILSFSRDGDGGGHAVAVHQKGADYLFFDPNFGAFKFSRDNLMNALQHLFWAPVFKVKAGSTVLDGDKAVYLRRKKVGEEAPKPMNKVGYTIFERAPG